MRFRKKIDDAKKKVNEVKDYVSDKIEYAKPDEVKVKVGPIKSGWEFEGPRQKAHKDGVREGHEASRDDRTKSFIQGAKKGFFGK